MKIELVKFGTMLMSRPSGKEAWLSAMAYILPKVKRGEKVTVDFTGVQVLTPSWADEFLTALNQKFPGQVEYLPNDNPTVQETLRTIKD